MNKFAFIIHPLEREDFFRKLKFMRRWPESWVDAARHIPSFKVSDITGVQSPVASCEGLFVGCPLTAAQILSLPEEYVLSKIIKAGKLAEKKGAKIVGLGAMTSVVGDAGITIAKNLDIAVTTGNSYTVGTALEGTREAARLMGHDLGNAQVLVVGATGSIGSVCARILARDVRFLTLLARNTARLERLAGTITAETGLVPTITQDVKEAVQRADIIVAVSGAAESLIHAEDLKPGAVVCDVARPRDVSKSVAEQRPDVLVIEGGVVAVPGDVDFNFNFGFPPKTSYACMAETMILTLEGRFESFSLGRDMSVSQIDEICLLAKKHGFRLGGMRSFERAVSPQHIESVRQAAEKAKYRGEKLVFAAGK
jgi:fatty aldehyde-generating acyl-ACP reductase